MQGKFVHLYHPFFIHRLNLKGIWHYFFRWHSDTSILKHNIRGQPERFL